MTVADEQTLPFGELPPHVARIALVKVNTGCREQEVCGLKWEREVPVSELATSVFIIPGKRVKNGEERSVVLSRVARPVIDEALVTARKRRSWRALSPRRTRRAALTPANVLHSCC